MSISCKSPDSSCPLLYHCNSQNLCVHDQVFPITDYQFGVFSLFPLAAALCNLSGNSFGQFKVLLLMDLLNYQQNQSTVLAYPLITGTALFNFLDLIFKKHPHKRTSLVDYNIVLIIIPNLLYGSTIGGIVNLVLPPVAADCLIIVMMSLFSIKFFMKWSTLRKKISEQGLQSLLLTAQNQPQQKQCDKQIQNKQKQEQEIPQNLSGKQQEDIGEVSIQGDSLRNSSLRESLVIDTSGRQMREVSEFKNYPVRPKTFVEENVENTQYFSMEQDIAQNVDKIEQQKQQINPLLEKHLRYQQSYHVKDIMITIIIFIVFTVLSLLAQGKIIPFSMCSQIYPFTMSLLTLFVVGLNVGIYFYTKKNMKFYQQIGYTYTEKLGDLKIFLIVSIGSVFAGLNNGIFGTGTCPTIILALLILDLEPSVAAATVGYQVVFAGSSSTVQAMLEGNLPYDVGGLFIGVTFFVGGLMTFLLRIFVNRFSELKVNAILVFILLMLVFSSVLALIVSVIMGYLQFGADNMNTAPGIC